jgi:trans-aconitate 2-methyltransferase
MPWDPAQYLKFVDHRLRPAIDLLNRIDLADPAEICDLGAGAGNVTRHLRARWPHAHIVGVDESAAMLAKAAEIPGIDWQRADLATWQPQRAVDLVYSNAALHWVGDHARLFPALLGMLAPGGVLAVQMPRMFTAPTHTLVAEAARRGPWRARLEPLLRPPPVAEPGFYYDLLAPRAVAVDIWETEYLHVLAGDDPVKEWLKGSWLAPFLAALDEPQRSDFESCYARLVAQAYPRRPDGRTLLPFRRLFIVASVSSSSPDASESTGRAGPGGDSGG